MVLASLLVMGMLLCVAFLTSSRDVRTTTWLPVVDVSQLPADGTPLEAKVSLKRFDAWMRMPDVTDKVFVRKQPGSQQVLAFPPWHHSDFRIPIRYEVACQQFVSTCWNVAFDANGNETPSTACLRDSSVKLRLNELPVRVLEGRVWVLASDLFN